MVSCGEKAWLIRRLQADELGSTRVDGSDAISGVGVVDDEPQAGVVGEGVLWGGEG